MKEITFIGGAMQKINSVFFGEHGITSTSANHLSNLAKELIVAYESKINNLNFVTTRIDIVGSQSIEGKIIQQGLTEKNLHEVKEALEKISILNAFSAWMREAIKAKEEEGKLIKYKKFEEWLEENNLELDEKPDMDDNEYDSTDVISEFTIRERNEYYYYQAVAASIGKYIHPKGVISEARAQLHNCILKPYSTKGEGKDTLVLSHEPSVDVAVLDELFFELQKWHRTNEQKLNQIKYAVKRKLSEKEIEKNSTYKFKSEQYKSRKEELMIRFKDWQLKENQKIMNLKIVIPEALQEIYDYLSSLEK